MVSDQAYYQALEEISRAESQRDRLREALIQMERQFGPMDGGDNADERRVIEQARAALAEMEDEG